MSGLDLVLLLHQLPEARFGDDEVGSEDFVFVDSRVLFVDGGSGAAND